MTLTAEVQDPGSINISIGSEALSITNEPAIIRKFIPELKLYAIRPDAELLETWTKDSLAVTDDSKSIPAYNTTAQTIISAESLTPKINLDRAHYDYYLVESILTIPVYNTSTIAKSRNEYEIGVGMYELVDIPANSFEAANGTKYASEQIGVGTTTLYRMLYWSSTSALSVYTSTSYGVDQVFAAPTVSEEKWTVKAPSLQMRGSTSYLTSTVWGTVTDIRRQYVIKAYRAPKNNFNIDGWGSKQGALHIMDCANSSTKNLT